MEKYLKKDSIKTEEKKPGRKYPRYSLTPETEREKRQIILDEQWIENISIIIVELEKNAAKISFEIFAIFNLIR